MNDIIVNIVEKFMSMSSLCGDAPEQYPRLMGDQKQELHPNENMVNGRSKKRKDNGKDFRITRKDRKK